ncbi:hypothetical protein F5888DRAFT_1249963 [Russula emetica]|nr:hypothetical protein F5888DRAFT_1249963 [Russula emetica]
MSHPHLACISYLKPNSPVEVNSLSLFPVFSPCQAFKSVVQYRPHVSIHSNPHITLCTHAITSSPSFHPRSLRVWILVAWLFAFVCHPAVMLSGSPATCAVSLFGLRVSPPPFRPLFFLGLKHILPAIPAITVTIIYASHRSKHVLPVSFCFVVTYYTSCSITCSFPAISSDILIAKCFLFLYFFPPTFTEH